MMSATFDVSNSTPSYHVEIIDLLRLDATGHKLFLFTSTSATAP
jgi:hypothetical protein